MPRILMSSIKRFAPPKGKLGMLACGILLGLSAPGYGLWPLAWVGLIPVMLHLQRTEHAKTALTDGFIAGAAFHMTWMGWLLSLHPLDWLGFSPVGSLLVALGAWLTAGILYGGLTALILLLYWRACRLEGGGRTLTLGLFPIKLELHPEVTVTVTVTGSNGSSTSALAAKYR